MPSEWALSLIDLETSGAIRISSGHRGHGRPPFLLGGIDDRCLCIHVSQGTTLLKNFQRQRELSVRSMSSNRTIAPSLVSWGYSPAGPGSI